MLVIEGLPFLLLLSLVVGCVTLTLSKAWVFKPLRDYLASKSDFLGDLLNCTYCTSHWVSAGVFLVFQPKLLQFPVTNAILCWLLMVVFGSGALWFIFQCHSAVPSDED